MILASAFLVALAGWLYVWAGSIPSRPPTGTTAGTGAARPSRRRREAPALDPVVAYDLLAVVVSAGAPIPRAIEALGEAAQVPGVAEMGRLLRLGAGWDEAIDGVDRDWAGVLEPMRAAWIHGVDPTSGLRVAAATVRSRRSAQARVEAERLAVRLVLPLGLCFLPAFVLLGLVPVVISVGGDLFSSW